MADKDREVIDVGLSADSPASASRIIKVSFNLPAAEVEELRRLAARRGTTVTQALRLALALAVFTDEQLARGSELLVRDADGSSRAIRGL